MPGKIPVRMREEFVGYMEGFDDDSLPDGAWFANLEAAAHKFIRRKKLQWVHANDAVHQYLKIKLKAFEGAKEAIEQTATAETPSAENTEKETVVTDGAVDVQGT